MARIGSSNPSTAGEDHRDRRFGVRGRSEREGEGLEASGGVVCLKTGSALCLKSETQNNFEKVWSLISVWTPVP